MKRLGVAFVLTALICGAAVAAQAGDFMDTWVTFAISDDNLLAGAADRSPGTGFHYTGNQAFFDNLDRSATGYETLAHLVLYKRLNSYFPHLELEAALVIQLENVTDEVTWENETQLGDDGSYINLNYYFDAATMRGDRLGLTLFPVNSDRFRLGYAYDLSWGGNVTWPTNTQPVPGMKLRWDFGTADSATLGGYLYGGVKAARLLNQQINEVDTYYGFLAGLGLDFSHTVMWEANGGLFQKGPFPPQTVAEEITDKPIDAHGASTRLTWRSGMPIGESVDFRLYRNDMDSVRQALAPEQYDDSFSHRVSLEATYREQQMLAWDDPTTVMYEPAMASNLSLRFKYRNWRFHADAVYRQLSYILFDVPGLAPYYAYPDDATTTDEFFVAGGVDYFFPSAHLTLGLVGGYKRPATYQGPTDIPDAATDQNIIVVRDVGDMEILPAGENAFDIVTIKPTIRLDLADGFGLLGEVDYTIDNNRTKYIDDEEGIAKRVFDDYNVTHILGFSLLMQARF